MNAEPVAAGSASEEAKPEAPNGERSVILFFGPPGSGKTTMTGRLAADPDAAHLSTGRLLRSKAGEDTVAGRRVAAQIDRGAFVASDLVVRVLVDRIREIEHRFILLDGFPRLPEQADDYFEICREAHLRTELVFILAIGREEAFRRLTSRRICPECGAVYNVHRHPPEHAGHCDRCGATLERRPDDDPENVRYRWAIYQEETKPLVERFRADHPEMTQTIESDVDPDAEFEAICGALQRRGLNFKVCCGRSA